MIKLTHRSPQSRDFFLKKGKRNLPPLVTRLIFPMKFERNRDLWESLQIPTGLIQNIKIKDVPSSFRNMLWLLIFEIIKSNWCFSFKKMYFFYVTKDCPIFPPKWTILPQISVKNFTNLKKNQSPKLILKFCVFFPCYIFHPRKFLYLNYVIFT